MKLKKRNLSLRIKEDSVEFSINVNLIAESALPIFTANNNYIDRLTINKTDTSDVINNVILNLYDKEYPDRISYIGNVRSTMSENNIYMFFDNKYGDIIILPDQTMLTKVSSGKTLDINVKLLGYGDNTDKYSISQEVTVDTSVKYKLPKTKLNDKMRNLVLKLFENNSDYKKESAFLLMQFSNYYQIQNESFHPFNIVHLGKYSDLFESNSRIPLYTLENLSFTSPKIEFNGVVAVEDPDLYISFRF